MNEEQRYALVEYVTHLVAKDYDATLGDLVTLGFIDPQIGKDPEKSKIIIPLLATVSHDVFLMLSCLYREYLAYLMDIGCDKRLMDVIIC